MCFAMVIETVCTTYENLKLDDDDDDPSPMCQIKANSGSNNKQLEYLWKSNEQLQNDIIKVCNALICMHICNTNSRWSHS